jgi:ribonucleoside-diphosphate reductase alpha chain
MNPEIRFASSVLDYIARWLGGKFISSDYLKLNGSPSGEMAPPTMSLGPVAHEAAQPSRSMDPPSAAKLHDLHEGAPTCSECGMLMTPNGGCYKCENCGSTSGCS